VLVRESRGGFLVESVLPGSRYERAGLRPGDTVYSLDLPDQPAIDENNMIAMTSVKELAFDVVRQGVQTRLSTRLGEEVSANATPQ
jgi:S1-C subfamily serine protease